MKLTEINITRYGDILPPFNFKPGGKINVVYGPNGSGKTLIINALLKLLAGRKKGWNERIDRIAEKPRGYIAIEHNEEKFTVDEETPLNYHLEEIGSAELRNIFVVRDTELQIDKESRFYETLYKKVDQVAGLRTTEIRQIMETLKEKGRLTPTQWNISKHSKFDNAGEELENAEDLHQEVEEYIEEAKEKELDKKEAELLESKARRKELKHDEEKLEKAKKKESYVKLNERNDFLKKALSELSDQPDGITSLKDKLRRVEDKETGARQLEEAKSLYRKLSYVSLAGSILTFLVFVLAGVPFFATLIPLLLVVLLAIFLIQWKSKSTEISEIDHDKLSILNEAQSIGLDVKEFNEVRRRISEKDEEIEQLKENIQQKVGVLRDGLRIETDKPEEVANKAAEVLEDMKSEVSLDVKGPYDKGKHNDIKEELEELEDKIDDYRRKVEGHKQVLREFSKSAHSLPFREFTRKPLDLEIDNLNSLSELLTRLDEFINKIKEDAHLSKKALEVWDEIEAEEEEKTEELFGEDNKTSEILREVTEGAFTAVSYEPDRGIVLSRESGSEESVHELSRAEYSQLYFAVRIALAQRLLGAEEGFFIVEDPFLPSDSQRLQKQIDLLKSLSDEGWQIIYFTAKDDIKESLSTMPSLNVKELTRISDL